MNTIASDIANGNDKKVPAPEIEPLTWKLWKKKRYIVAFVLLFGVFNSFTLRTIMSVAVVAMTEIKTIRYENGTVGQEQEFSWTSKEQGVLLGAIYYGYFCCQIVGGYIAPKLGGTIVFGLGIGIASFLTILTPFTAPLGQGPLIAHRVLVGAFEGIATAAFYEINNKWAPPAERTTMIALATTGFELGTIASMFLSGIFAERFGWQSIFYIFGSFGCIWYIIFAIVVSESPAKDKYISDDEKRYIIESQEMECREKLPIPWKAIFSSTGVYALIGAGSAHAWGAFTLLTSLPKFLKDAMNYDVTNSGILSAAPYIGMTILMPVIGILADYLRAKKIWTTTQVRRYFTLIGFISQSIFLVLVAYLMDPVGSIVCVVLAVSIGSFANNGYIICPLDMAPQFASIIVGLTNTIASLPGLISPIVTGIIVENKAIHEWRLVFYIAAGIYLIGAVVFGFFGTAEIQSWAKETSYPKSTERRNSTTTNDTECT